MNAHQRKALANRNFIKDYLHAFKNIEFAVYCPPHDKVLKKLMEMPNAICIVGNHELMALECLEFLMKEITDMSIEELDEEMLDNLVTWQFNGSKSTIDPLLENIDDEYKEC